jgi:hypothetical protein
VGCAGHPGRRVEWWGAFLVSLPLNVAFFSKGGLVGTSRVSEVGRDPMCWVVKQSASKCVPITYLSAFAMLQTLLFLF